MKQIESFLKCNYMQNRLNTEHFGCNVYGHPMVDIEVEDAITRQIASKIFGANIKEVESLSKNIEL